MRRLAISLAVATMAFTSAASAEYSIGGDECSRHNFRWNDRYAYVATETIDGASLRSLKLSVTNAPVSVNGGSAAGYSIEVCKAAELESDLAAIRVFLDGEELKATGPEDRHWVVTYRIQAPHGADLDLEAKNGPISLHDVDGTVDVRAKNGPLTLDNVSGTVSAVTNNGPVSIDGGSGTMKVEAKNGPLSVHLDGGSWSGGRLDASTKNGPLSVRVPRNYGSRVVVEALGRGPVSCSAEDCEATRVLRPEDLDDDQARTFSLGSGAEAVHLTTVNGPVTIKDR